LIPSQKFPILLISKVLIIDHFFLERSINNSKVHPKSNQRKIEMYIMFMMYFQNAYRNSSRNLRRGQYAIQTQNNMFKLTCLPILVDGFGMGVAIFLVVVLFLFAGIWVFVCGGGVGVLHEDPTIAGGWNLILFLSPNHSEL
jgi:hypothetical protein